MNASAMAIGWFAMLSGSLTAVSWLLKSIVSHVCGVILHRPKIFYEDYRRRYAAWLFELEALRIAADLTAREKRALPRTLLNGPRASGDGLSRISDQLRRAPRT